MELKIQDLSPEAFAPFGSIIEQPGRPTDANGPGWNWWGEMMQLQGGDRNYAVGYLDLTPAPLCFDWAERHMISDEMVIPLTGDCLVYVGHADHPSQPDRLPEQDRFQVFRIKQGQAVVFKPGVWHGAPMAVDQPAKVLVLLLHNTSVQDGYVQRFEEKPITIRS